MFIDKDATNTYLHGNGCGSSPTECVEKFVLRNNVRIVSVCDGSGNCYSTGQTTLHIKFLRPDPAAILTFINPSGTPSWGNVSSINLISPGGLQATIVVSRTGSIQVQ